MFWFNLKVIPSSVNDTRRMEQNKNIVYGGPDPPNVGEGTKSLGEFLIKRMKEFGDEIAFVSNTIRNVLGVNG